jgi:DNA-binding LacI/PurR family transcriptional regulator
MTLGALQALKELKVLCPEQISVIGFDECDWAAVFNPAITAIAQPTEEMGNRAVELLLESIQSPGHGAEIKTRQVLLKSSLRIRASTGPPPNALASTGSVLS